MKYLESYTNIFLEEKKNTILLDSTTSEHPGILLMVENRKERAHEKQ
jgi:hypothetical protein